MINLPSALAARDAARTKHKEAAAALERTRTTAASAQAEATRLEAAERSWIERHSRKLAEWIASGSKGAQPVLAADAKAQQALTSARAGAAAAVHALAGFESGERESRQALAVAESAARAAALSALAAERDDQARQIICDDEKLEARKRSLRGADDLLPPSELVRRAAPRPEDWLHTSLVELHDRQRQVDRRDARLTPANELRGQELGEDPVTRAAVEQWEHRLEQLLTGAGVPPSPVSEERAA